MLNMSLCEVLNSTNKSFSIELCPSSHQLVNVESLKSFRCDFVSVVWLKKENSTKERTFSLCKQLIDSGYAVILHLAGKDLKQDECLHILSKAKDIGVKNIFALQGDPLRIKDGGDFAFAADLVVFIRKHFEDYFTIGVAGYPSEVKDHQSMEYLKNKVDKGANFIVTQATFEYDEVINFCIQCQRMGITKPILCGIFTINSYATYEIITKQCNIQVPDNLSKTIEENRDDNDFIQQYGLELSENFVKKIFNSSCDNIKGIHVFSLNDISCVNKLSQKLDFLSYK